MHRARNNMDKEGDKISICKICKKVFVDVKGLRVHQMNQHPQQAQHLTVSQHFQGNSISVTKIQNDANSVPSILKNQSPFRKTTAGNGAAALVARKDETQPMKKQTDGRANIVRSSTGSALQKLSAGLDDDTTDWRKWKPASKEGEMSTIITQSVAVKATEAFRSSPGPQTNLHGMKNAKQQQRKVPPMFRIHDVGLPKNDARKRPAPGAAAGQRNPVGVRAVPPTTGASAVAGIMQNLGKMKSMNQAATTNKASSNLISMPPRTAITTTSATKRAEVPANSPTFHVSKPPPVSKNKGKILPRNAFNNALPKPGAKGAHALKHPPHLSMESEMDFEDDDPEDDESDFIAPPELMMETGARGSANRRSPTKSSPTKSRTAPSDAHKISDNRGKITSQKSINSQRFNPMSSDSKSQLHNSSKLPGTMNKANNGKPAMAAKKSNSREVRFQKVAYKKIKQCVPTMPGIDYEMPPMTAVGSFTRNGVQVWVCLVCNEKEEEQSSQDMICCDGCEDWYHWGCVGIRKSIPEDQPWYCKRCIYQNTADPAKEFPALFKNNNARQ